MISEESIIVSDRFEIRIGVEGKTAQPACLRQDERKKHAVWTEPQYEEISAVIQKAQELNQHERQSQIR